MADLESGVTLFVAVERESLKRLRRVASALYREDRLSGDQMRDLAHTITSVLDGAIDLDPKH